MLYNIDTLSETLVDFMKIPQKFGWVWVEREDFVAEHLKSLIPELEEDEVGNLYWINPNTPLINAHMDTVGSAEAQNHVEQISYCDINLASVLDTTTWIKWSQEYDSVSELPAPGIDKKAYDARKFLDAYESTVKWIIGTHNIGADDKCGIVLAYALYKEFGNKISLLFTRWEETGMHGVRHFCKEHNDLLSQCTYCILGDRRNWWDLICNVHASKYGSKEFEEKVLEIIWDYWFTSVQWGGSDMNYIKEYLNWFNISVWYYNPHMDSEYVIAEEYFNTYKAMHSLVSNFNEKLPVVKFTYPSYSYHSNPMSWYEYWKQKTKLSNTYWFFCFSTYRFSNVEYVQIDKPVMFAHEDYDCTYFLPAWVLKLSMIKGSKAQKRTVVASALNLPVCRFSYDTKNPKKPTHQSTSQIESYDDTTIKLDRDLLIQIESEYYYTFDKNATNIKNKVSESGYPKEYFIPKGTYTLSTEYVSDLFFHEKRYLENLYKEEGNILEYNPNTGLLEDAWLLSIPQVEEDGDIIAG